MSAMDPEDALDQLLNSTWSNMAQQLGMLHRSLSVDIQQRQRERRGEHARQARLQAAEIKEMEARRAQLLSWESAHRRELNNGFESVLNATVLGHKGCAPLSDTSLLKAWNVSEMLVGTDPGYAPRLERARRLMDEEWSGRHPGETIGQWADRVMNRVTVAYVDRSPQLDDTLAAFEKGDSPSVSTGRRWIVRSSGTGMAGRRSMSTRSSARAGTGKGTTVSRNA